MESGDLRGESGVPSDWLVRLLRGFAVGRELGPSGGPAGFSSASHLSDFLLPPKRLLESESRWRDRLGGAPAEPVRLVFLSRVVVLMVLSSLLPLSRWMRSLEEEIRGPVGSDGFLLREETLAGGFLSSRSRSSCPWRPSLFSL